MESNDVIKVAAAEQQELFHNPLISQRRNLSGLRHQAHKGWIDHFALLSLFALKDKHTPQFLPLGAVV